MNQFTVLKRLPGLNDLIAKNRLSKYAGAELKRKTENLICEYIRGALEKGTLHPVNGQCAIAFTWWEPNRKRDLDNIYSAKKFVLDAMVKEKIIPNDSQKYVVSLTDHIRHNAVHTGVTVVIEEVDYKIA